MGLASNVLADLISDELPYDYRPAAWRGSADSLRWIVFLRIGPTLIVRAVFKLFFRMISGSTRGAGEDKTRLSGALFCCRECVRISRGSECNCYPAARMKTERPHVVDIRWINRTFGEVTLDSNGGISKVGFELRVDGAAAIVYELWYGDRGQQANDRNDHQQFDQGVSSIRQVLTGNGQINWLESHAVISCSEDRASEKPATPTKYRSNGLLVPPLSVGALPDCTYNGALTHAAYKYPSFGIFVHY